MYMAFSYLIISGFLIFNNVLSADITTKPSDDKKFQSEYEEVKKAIQATNITACKHMLYKYSFDTVQVKELQNVAQATLEERYKKAYDKGLSRDDIYNVAKGSGCALASVGAYSLLPVPVKGLSAVLYMVHHFLIPQALIIVGGVALMGYAGACAIKYITKGVKKEASIQHYEDAYAICDLLARYNEHDFKQTLK